MNAASQSRGPDDALTTGPWIEIFLAGTHTDSTGRQMAFTEDHLDEIVRSYDPATHEAPVVVGHPKTDDPALGWIAGLKRDGLKLLAQERQVAPEFETAREDGRYKKRSASFYLPDSPGNPTPGKLHLRHVGWLGGMPPAIKGMADRLKRGNVAFSQDDGEGVVEFSDMAVAYSVPDSLRAAPRWVLTTIADMFDRFRDDMVARDGVDAADRILPRWQINSLREAGLVQSDVGLPAGFGEGEEEDTTSGHEPPNPEEDAAMTQKAEEIAAAQEKLDADRAELDRKQTEFNERERVAGEAASQAAAEEQRVEATEFADGLVREGKLLPKFKAGIVALYQAAQQIVGPLTFGEGDDAGEAPATQIVRDALSVLPKAFDFTEKSGETGESVDVNDPNAIAKAATEFKESEHKAGRTVSFAQAVSHITKGA